MQPLLVLLLLWLLRKFKLKWHCQSEQLRPAGVLDIIYATVWKSAKSARAWINSHSLLNCYQHASIRMNMLETGYSNKSLNFIHTGLLRATCIFTVLVCKKRRQSYNNSVMLLLTTQLLIIVQITVLSRSLCSSSASFKQHWSSCSANWCSSVISSRTEFFSCKNWQKQTLALISLIVC